MTKHFKLSAEQIRPFAAGRGSAISSDRITVDGRPVGYMYRTRPHHNLDSGWAFLAGDENDAYMAEPENHAIYDVNTIANYDNEIIPLLDAPVGSAFIRTPSGLGGLDKLAMLGEQVSLRLVDRAAIPIDFTF